MPDIREIEDRMRPGRYSKGGFLGPKESLQEVLEYDSKILKRLHITAAELAEPLDKLITAALETGRRYVKKDQFEIKLDIFKGFQICPWAENPHQSQCTMGKGVKYSSIDWSISNTKNKKNLRGPGLIVHLIRDHHFFEGLKSPYRVDPVKLSDLLEIVGR